MIDCPHNGRKNVADQMMIVDMLTFAIDNESDGSTIVLISGDRDFAYPVSILRFRMCQVIVISPTLPGAHLSLRSQASTFLDWTVMVSGLKDDKSSVDANIPLPPTNTGAQNSGKSNIHDVTNFRPQTRHSPEAFPPPPRSEVTEREAPIAPAATPDSTPPVYAATVSTASETVPPTTLSPAGNHVNELAPVAKYVLDGLQKQATLIDGPSTSPLVHSPNVPPTVFPSSYQTQSDAKGPWTIPLHLRSLVRVLQKYLENGITQPLRSIVAAKLVALDSKVYENAGVTTFWELFRLAVKESLVWWGDQGDDVWVALHPSAVENLQLLDDDDSPLSVAISMPSTTPTSSRNEVDAMSITVDSTPPVYATATIAAADDFASPTTPPSAQSSEPAPVARCADDGLRKQIIDRSDEPLPPPPALTAASPSSPNAPSPPQGQFDATATWTVPLHLRSLVRVLQKYLEDGITQPLRTIVAAELVAQDSKVYESAGVTTFWELFRLAMKESLVWWGDQGDDVWVALHPSAVQKLHDSPLNATILMSSSTPTSLGNEAPVVPTTVANTPVYAAIATSEDFESSTGPRTTPATWYANDEPPQQKHGLLDEPLPPPPVPATPPLPTSDPPSSQSQSDATVAWAVPLHLRSLVRVLLKQHENGNTQVRSTIAAELVAQDSKAYENAGVTTFWELVGLAVRERVVWCGGHGDDVWISLTHCAVKDSQSSVDESPLDANIPVPPTAPGSEAPPVDRATNTTPPVHAAVAIATTAEPALPTTSSPAQNLEFAAVAQSYDELQNLPIAGPLGEPLPPSVPVAPSLLSSAPSTSQNQSDATAAWTVPLHLRSLVRVLQNYLKNGTTQPLRSIVAAELVAQDSKVYESAGVTTFWELFRLAIKESLVWWGDQGDDVWVALHPNAVQKLVSLEDNLNAAILMPSTTPAAPRNEALVLSTASTTDNTHTLEVRTVPRHLRSLVSTLQEHCRETGETQPLWGSIAYQLVQQDSEVYSKAGVTKFKDFVELASKEGLVWLGGTAGREWVSLQSNLSRSLVPAAMDDTPSPAALSPLPLSAPLPCQSQSSTLGGWTVPVHLRILVRILQKHREKGKNQPLRGSVALELTQQDSKVYEKAGVTRFKEFVDLATKLGLVCLGGTEGGAWISLHHDAVNKLRSNPLI
ncbi:hypothetical protein PQX77_014349 [Marasmius sp. AFHP31]|nr:hypothetical protein PQX77_014349 [Marasmius sp. AFHP31]